MDWSLPAHYPHTEEEKCSRTDAWCTSRAAEGKARFRDLGLGLSWLLSRKMWINRANFLAFCSSPPIHLPILQLRIEGEEEIEQAAA